MSLLQNQMLTKDKSMHHQLIQMDDTNKRNLELKYIIYKIWKIELCKFVFFMNRKNVFFKETKHRLCEATSGVLFTGNVVGCNVYPLVVLYTR